MCVSLRVHLSFLKLYSGTVAFVFYVFAKVKCLNGSELQAHPALTPFKVMLQRSYSAHGKICFGGQTFENPICWLQGKG